ncbi:MAG TPA: hypothetical protein VF450_20160 [Noviherbaspirillum sp.]
MSQGMKRTLIPLVYADTTTWHCPDISVLDAEDQALFTARKTAVEMYAHGDPYHVIREATHKRQSEVRRLVHRCLIPAGDGAPLGFYALLPHVRFKQYTRKAIVHHEQGEGSGGCAGALEQLFRKHPDIRQSVEDDYLKVNGRKCIPEPRISLRTVHRHFKEALRKKGFTDNDWPFNTFNCGYSAICRYCKFLELKRTSRSILARSGIDAARREIVGNGYQSILPCLRGYSFVQLDYQKIDAASIITIRNDHGVEHHIPISRWHIALLVEERYGPVIGAYVALELTPSGDTTLEVIESALKPCDKREGDPRYALVQDGKVFVIDLIPDLAYQCFSALKVDNAWCHAAHEVINNIIDTVGCSVNFGPTYGWWRRALVEHIIGKLSARGLQRLPSTYGSGPGDTRVEDPQGKAIKFRIMLSDLIAIIYAVIREHNLMRTERLQWSSPIECIRIAQQHPASGLFHQPLPRALQDNPRLLAHIEEVTVRGNLTKGRRPYFISDRCAYTNPKLAHAHWLIGKKLIIYVNRRKCRLVSATVKETGEQLGMMVPSRRWAASDCSWRDRKLLNRIGFAERCADESPDPMQQFCTEKARKLMSRKKSKHKKASADALHVARYAMARVADAVAPTTPVTAPSTQTTPTSAVDCDPFGLDKLPTTTKSVSRRTRS